MHPTLNMCRKCQFSRVDIEDMFIRGRVEYRSEEEAYSSHCTIHVYPCNSSDPLNDGNARCPDRHLLTRSCGQWRVFPQVRWGAFKRFYTHKLFPIFKHSLFWRGRIRGWRRLGEMKNQAFLKSETATCQQVTIRNKKQTFNAPYACHNLPRHRPGKTWPSPSPNPLPMGLRPSVIRGA